MSTINYEIITFKAISEFTKELCENFSSKEKNHSLKLYEHLLNKTTLSHDKAIKKHIDAFREFCISNRDAISNKNSSLLVNNKVIYSSRVYIDFSSIFKEADKESTNIIWKHLLTISALVDPAGKAKEILKNNADSKEANFLSDIINKVESNVNPNSNPLEAISSIMSSGVFNELITGMNSGIQNGDLDLGKLMGTVQTMCSSLSADINGNDSNSSGSSNNENPMNMLTSLMSTMNTNNKDGGGGMPDLSNITNLLGPMLTTLNNNSTSGNIDNNKKLKDPKNLTLVENSIKEIANNIESKSSDTLIQTIDFLNDEFWLKQDQYFKMANSFIDQLLKRIDPKTKFVKGTELTAADLDSIRMDLAETINNEKLVIDLRKKVIGSYEKLISFFDSHGSKDLRSMNLEYGFLLWKDGRIEEAKKLYDHFIKKYPAEFTFYFAATKMYLGIKDYTKAREYGEKALNFSYGDNRIRSMERLITVMVEQGEKKEALMRGNEFLKNLKIPEGLNVRTTRYAESLKKLLVKTEQEGKK